MITNSLSIEASFELDADRIQMENKYDINIVDTTKHQKRLCFDRNEIYHGPKTYLLIGRWENIVNYLVNDYKVDGVDMLTEYLNEVKTVEI